MHPIDLRDLLSCILPFPAKKGPAPWAAGMGQSMPHRCVGVKCWVPPEPSAPSQASAAHVFLGYRAGSLPSTLFFLGWARKAFLPIALAYLYVFCRHIWGCGELPFAKNHTFFFFTVAKNVKGDAVTSHIWPVSTHESKDEGCVYLKET